MNELSNQMTMDNFAFFWQRTGTYGCFSQWYKSPFEVDGITYQTAEQFMMAKKALLFNDFEHYTLIMNEMDPKVCKQYGRLVNNFDAEIWDKYCFEVVYHANLAKFCQNEKLKTKLLLTGDKIIAEASPYDTIWGIGMKKEHPDAINPELWKGQNLLGKVLMKVREELLKNV